jgi:hypothetical protein
MLDTGVTLFISYAHNDAREFVQRLSLALEVLAGKEKVFWDAHLTAGEFPPQLEQEIRSCSHFLQIMTPSSLSSDWCKRELSIAADSGKLISLARLFSEKSSIDPVLLEKYTCADFSVDFEPGFRRLCQLLFGRSFSSWEALAAPGVPDQVVIGALRAGHVPGLIAKEIVEWVVIAKLWKLVEEYALPRNRASFGTPQTLNGAVRM